MTWQSRPASLCQLADVWRGAIPPGGAWTERKHDGWRAAYAPTHDGRPALWSRNGMPLNGVDHIIAALGRIQTAWGEPMMFDGELVVDGTLAATKAHCESGWKSGRVAGVFHLFDGMPLADWQRDNGTATLAERKRDLALAMLALDGDPLSWEWTEGSRGKWQDASPVELVEGELLPDADAVRAFAQAIWDSGGEGAVVKNPDAPYRRKRTQDWQKVKHPDYVPGVGILRR